MNQSHQARKALKPIIVTQVVIGTKITPVLDGFASDKVGVFVLSKDMNGDVVLSFKLINGIVEGL